MRHKGLKAKAGRNGSYVRHKGPKAKADRNGSVSGGSGGSVSGGGRILGGRILVELIHGVTVSIYLLILHARALD